MNMNNEAKKNNSTALYNELKAKYPEAILMFRTGDFYLMYKQDAIEAGKILSLDYSRATDGTAIAGFPHHALDIYLPKIVRANRKVAILEPLEEETKMVELVAQRR